MLFRDATLADGRVRDVRIDGESIVDVGTGLDDDGETIDADGKRLLPGMIDAHVHFRQPGFPHKETWLTGSKSAAAGGVTTVFDQPNTEPPTVDAAGYERKAELASASLVDYAINGGVTDDWAPEELLEKPIGALGEVFLADSTGEMGIGTGRYEEAVKRAHDAGVPITVHAEDAALFDESVIDRTDPDAWSAYRTAAAEIEAIRHACRVAADLGARVHIAHTSTPEGVEATSEAGMTCEVTPHHLFLSRADLEELGTFGRMNPPLRSEDRRESMLRLLADGDIDIVATDHAPHTRTEKDAGIWDAPSGVPGVETALPLLLEEARNGRLGYDRIRDVTAANVADIFGLEHGGRIEAGNRADLVLVDPDASVPIRGEDLHSKCEWTPFEGRRGVFPELTTVRGCVVFRDGEFADVAGRNVRR
ncbi:dihydroorotase [Natronomonas moolapensis 8.8.11]|uniref:Dihydroorotase n=1 Tax=Natronomonas moolapensis (strain DSM 18674 / CECT 7526 / JCM 14361 / 8.8.11) TaxID=268739 RepID=M1XKP9_NATM8|nr:dihydroorotase [Natronomonas moolapensis]CCQ36292.1 dihydroorotase [Natronomonas moolapensis 8.8.11]